MPRLSIPTVNETASAPRLRNTYFCIPVLVALPDGKLSGARILRSAPMKMKLFGGEAQINGVLREPFSLGTIFSWKSGPDPDKGVVSFA